MLTHSRFQDSNDLVTPHSKRNASYEILKPTVRGSEVVFGTSAQEDLKKIPIYVQALVSQSLYRAFFPRYALPTHLQV